jgi:microcystin-dependent protein
MDAFIGEIRLLPYSFAPQGWLACDGRMYPAQQYQILYAVIGITFGGSTTQQTFAVPNLGGRVVVGVGDDPVDTFDPTYAATGGAETVTVGTMQMPTHTHTLVGGTQAPGFRSNTPGNNWITPVTVRPLPSGSTVNANAFFNDATVAPKQLVAMNDASLSPYGGQGRAHENRQPYLAMQFCINFDGIYPARN